MTAIGFLLLAIGLYAAKTDNDLDPYSSNAQVFFGLCIIAGFVLMVAGVVIFLWRVAP